MSVSSFSFSLQCSSLPSHLRSGAFLLQVDVNTESGGLIPNSGFAVDFGEEPEDLPSHMGFATQGGTAPLIFGCEAIT